MTRKPTLAAFKRLKQKTAYFLEKHRKTKDIFKAVKIEARIQSLLAAGEEMKKELESLGLLPPS